MVQRTTGNLMECKKGATNNQRFWNHARWLQILMKQSAGRTRFRCNDDTGDFADFGPRAPGQDSNVGQILPTFGYTLSYLFQDPHHFAGPDSRFGKLDYRRCHSQDDSMIFCNFRLHFSHTASISDYRRGSQWFLISDICSRIAEPRNVVF